MRVCFDLSPAVYHRAGIGRSARELLVALLEVAPQHEYRVFYNVKTPDVAPEPPLDTLPRLTVSWGDKPWRLRALMAQYARRSQDALFPQCDLFHATDHVLPFLRHTPAVFTLHDLTHLLTRTHATLNRLYLRLALPLFLQRAQAIITPSHATLRDLQQRYPQAAGKGHVIPHGVHPRFAPPSDAEVARVRRKYQLPESFLLTVGTIEPRKNLVRLLEAHHRLRQRGITMPLVLAGRRGWRAEPFFRRREELQLQHEVRLLGFFPDEDLPGLYGAATLFIYPSLYEGFGLPVLEAMACGVPVVASNSSSLPEVMGDVGASVSPYDVTALADAIADALAHEAWRDEMRERGIRRARTFTWTASATRTAELYARVVTTSLTS